MAKKLDPSDPTPYFYDAIEKQTTNRPVEALKDLQRAIELNDNRAVYRSRLLLDADQAARSASLARIYSDLGFQQRVWSRVGNRSTLTRLIFQATDFWLILTLPCPGVKFQG